MENLSFKFINPNGSEYVVLIDDQNLIDTYTGKVEYEFCGWCQYYAKEIFDNFDTILNLLNIEKSITVNIRNWSHNVCMGKNHDYVDQVEFKCYSDDELLFKFERGCYLEYEETITLTNGLAERKISTKLLSNRKNTFMLAYYEDGEENGIVSNEDYVKFSVASRNYGLELYIPGSEGKKIPYKNVLKEYLKKLTFPCSIEDVYNELYDIISSCIENVNFRLFISGNFIEHSKDRTSILIECSDGKITDFVLKRNNNPNEPDSNEKVTIKDENCIYTKNVIGFCDHKKVLAGQLVIENGNVSFNLSNDYNATKIYFSYRWNSDSHHVNGSEERDIDNARLLINYAENLRKLLSTSDVISRKLEKK